jgi:hypothetical protein
MVTGELEVVKAVIPIAAALIGVYLGYRLSFKAQVRLKAAECYHTYVVPLINSIESLQVAVGTWHAIAEQYGNRDESSFNESEKRLINIATESVDFQGLKFMRFLRIFNASPARLVLSKMNPDIGKRAIALEQTLTVIMKNPEWYPRQTILAPVKFPLTEDLYFVKQIAKFYEELNKVKMPVFIKIYAETFGR